MRDSSSRPPNNGGTYLGVALNNEVLSGELRVSAQINPLGNTHSVLALAAMGDNTKTSYAALFSCDPQAHLGQFWVMKTFSDRWGPEFVAPGPPLPTDPTYFMELLVTIDPVSGWPTVTGRLFDQAGGTVLREASFMDSFLEGVRPCRDGNAGVFAQSLGGYVLDASFDNIRAENLRPTTLVWDGMGDGKWADISLVNNLSRWQYPRGANVSDIPDSAVNAVINDDSVVVEGHHAAKSLTVNGGQLAISEDATLSVVGKTAFAPGTTLVLGRGARLEVGTDVSRLEAVSAGDGSTIQGQVFVGGTLTPGEGLATLAIDGELELGATATYAVQVGSTGSDRITVMQDSYLDGGLEVSAASMVRLPSGSGQRPGAQSWGMESRTLM